MYNKNTQKNCHNALANCFNKKKTRENDISRLQNIHKKATPIQHFNFAKEKEKEKEKLDEFCLKPTEDIFKFENVKISTNLSLNFDKEEFINKIPKIQLKDIIIPFQNEHDAFDLNNINNNISVPIHMNIFIGDEFNEGDVNRLKKNKVSTIYHVYQQKYAYNIANRKSSLGISKEKSKALHSELLAELSGRFLSRNEYFRISEVRIVRHFFEVFGKFGISKFPKLPKLPNIRKNQFPKFPKFFRNFRTFSELFSKLFRTF
jgi:hypothetical protein